MFRRNLTLFAWYATVVTMFDLHEKQQVGIQDLSRIIDHQKKRKYERQNTLFQSILLQLKNKQNTISGLKEKSFVDKFLKPSNEPNISRVLI